MLHFRQKKSDVYKQALLLVKEVYRLTALFPAEEQLLLVHKLRRASITLCEKIAFAETKKSAEKRKKFYAECNFYCIEIDTHFEIAQAVRVLTKQELTKAEELLSFIYDALNNA